VPERALPTLTELFRDRRVRFAVTGLAQSGKTTFTTSLIHNLLAIIGRPARLPFFRAAAEARVITVRLQPAATESVPDFPFRKTLAALAADPPQWPPSTKDFHRARMALRFLPTGLLGSESIIGRLVGGSAELDLEILDYPGEWLLDLPLMQQSYRDWSRATLALAKSGVRAPLAKDWLNFLGSHRVDAPGDSETAARAHALYRDFVAACRSKQQLSLLQPGRVVNPGRIADPSLLCFCPLPDAANGDLPAGSLGALMEARYETYKRVIVEPFFTALAREVDRQIVLVDVLRTLNAGEAAFTDQRLALEAILGAFRFGRGGLLQRLFAARIDRVLFAATKADHVPAVQRDHLETLMANLVEAPTLRARRAKARVAATALASIRCTEDSTDTIDGHKVDVVVGLPLGGARRIRFFPGVVPVTPPPPGFWGERFTEFPVFQPPIIDTAAGNGIPHINLDKALDFLLEDVLA
jgi:hypothetical protein